MKFILSNNFFLTLHQRLAGSWQRVCKNSMNSGHQTECAESDAGDSKYEYAKSNAPSQGFPFQCQQDSPKTRHASVSCATSCATSIEDLYFQFFSLFSSFSMVYVVRVAE